MVVGACVGVGEVAYWHVEKSGEGYGLVPVRVELSGFPQVDCGFFCVAGEVDGGSSVLAVVEEVGDVPGDELAGMPEVVLIVAWLDEAAADSEVACESLEACEVFRRG